MNIDPQRKVYARFRRSLNRFCATVDKARGIRDSGLRAKVAEDLAVMACGLAEVHQELKPTKKGATK